MESRLEPQQFEARVHRTRSGGFVVLPFDPELVWGVPRRYDIAGAVGGHAIRGPLRRESGEWRIRLGPAWLRDHVLESGTQVTVVIAPEGPIAGRLAEDFANAMAANPSARTFFESLPTFYRRNFVRWIESAKRPETRDRRIRETVATLAAGRRELGAE